MGLLVDLVAVLCFCGVSATTLFILMCPKERYSGGYQPEKNVKEFLRDDRFVHTFASKQTSHYLNAMHRIKGVDACARTNSLLHLPPKESFLNGSLQYSD